MADSSLLEALSPVGSGDLIIDVVTAARMNAISALLRSLVAGDNLQSGEGIQITKSGNFGVVIGLSKTQAETDTKALLDRITALENRLNTLKANVVCNPDGTFTITFS